ncbi:MAG TPA: TetR family transcriptional regulator C-terminal domain-containing protein [Kiloniellaceae bacterium]|nr:TetR family transcriptional regulator C-terminal domain-containing protein [Kiloniellaceae bacterium]
MSAATVNADRAKRTEARHVRRRQLIEATIASIAELGFSDTTLTAVTKRAGLSHGTINFHFKSKEILFAETLGFLAREHFDCWQKAIAKAPPEPSAQLAAMIDVDFKPNICSPPKLAVWFSFWGQVKYRPAYLEAHDTYDRRRFDEFSRLCGEIIAAGEYDHVDAASAARRIEAMIDGLWLGMLLYPKLHRRGTARDDAFDMLAMLFPKHFDRPG